MKRVLLLFALIPAAVFTQEMKELQLGDSIVTFVTENPGSDEPVYFVNVHENEATSIEAVRRYDVNNAYRFIYLRHNGTRRIAFNIDGVVYSVDPNRIFSNNGIRETIQFDSLYHSKVSARNKTGEPPVYTYHPMWNVNKAAKMTRRLAREILKSLKNARCIISLHNNTPDNYSILSYLPGGSEAANTKDVYINPLTDSDDFIYTTSNFLFRQLKAIEVNVILQDNENCVDDGSMSVYCGRHGIPYANVEAEEGHLQEQVILIEKLMKVIALLGE